MKSWSTSIRTRLLIVYLGILCGGFIALALVAGEQISSAARADYEQRLRNEIQLIGQGVRSSLMDTTTTSEMLESLIQNYEAQTGGVLILISLEDRDRSPRTPSPAEIETAIRGEVVVVERQNDEGKDAFFTAAPISSAAGQPPRGVVQLSVPLSNLQTLIWQRWASLWLVFALVALVALVSAVILARSIIRPLVALRESAVHLSTGDFSHRVAYDHPDEIGAVARAFNEMARQVQSMLDEQRAFASNTSHELRTPLTTIRLRSEALRYDEGLDADTARCYMVEIDDEANRMSALIEDLTVLSRFDAGRAELGDDQIDLAHFAASLRQRMLPQAEARNIRLEWSSQPDIPPLRASLNHLTIVFRNLLDNAIKYTPDGGTVSWCLSAGVDGVRSLISDTGQGVEPGHLSRVFERFYRADRSRSRDVPGSGLGLAIVQSIVRAYGGSVSIESQGIGKGTTAAVFWPYRPVPATLEADQAHHTVKT